MMPAGPESLGAPGPQEGPRTARDASGGAAGPEDWDPAAFRDYLLVLARIHLDRRFDAKVSPSDVVQEALLNAHAALGDLRGRTPQERLAWLRRILTNAIQKNLRDLHRGKRDIRREQSLEAALERSILHLEMCLASGAPSPSERAQQAERILRVSTALVSLPDAQRDAVLYKYLGGLSQDEIAARLGRTSQAIAALIHRGLKGLRRRLEGEAHS